MVWLLWQYSCIEEIHNYVQSLQEIVLHSKVKWFHNRLEWASSQHKLRAT